MLSKLILLVLLWGVCVRALPETYFIDPIPTPPPPANCSSAYSCVGEGDTCVGAYGVNTNCANPTSNNISCCARGLFCIDSTCQTNNEGAICNNTASGVCYSTIPGLACLPAANGTCTYMASVGDTCNASPNNCLNNLNCSTTCTGLALYQPCTPGILQCAFGLYCGLNATTIPPSTQCLATLAAGAQCNLTTAQCGPSYYCWNSVCTAPYTVAVGLPCVGDLCATGNICASNATGFFCVAAQTSLTTCLNATADCPANVQCKCSSFSGKSYCADPTYNDCTDEDSSLTSCLVQYSCSTASLAPNSCAYSNCYSDLKKSQSCQCTSASAQYDSCFYNDFCGGFPVWAIIVIIVVAIVLVLAIVLLVFFMMRRRRQYDSI